MIIRRDNSSLYTEFLKRKLCIPLPNNLSFAKEISQEENQNATARLWIQSNGTVYKQYVIYSDLTKKNIDNLLRISSFKFLARIPELSLPLEIYATGSRVDGYLMKYHDMLPLGHYMREKRHPVVLSAFERLGRVINRLPMCIYVGDLHAGNILVGNDTIQLIDIDGFSLRSGHRLSCPLDNFSEHELFYFKKYQNSSGGLKLSKDSDICCLLALFLGYVMDTNPFDYTIGELKRYVTFLEDMGFPSGICEMLACMLSPMKNYLDPSAFSSVPTHILERCTYREFLRR